MPKLPTNLVGRKVSHLLLDEDDNNEDDTSMTHLDFRVIGSLS